MFRKVISLVLIVLLVSGCAVPEQKQEKKQYQATFLDLFDTVTTIIGYAQTEEEFGEITENIYNRLEKYHRLFNIYQEYEKNNIKSPTKIEYTAPPAPMYS